MMRAIKFIGIGSGILIAVLLVGICWVRGSWKDVYDQNQLDYMVERARIAPELPTGFTTTLTAVYPNVLDQGNSMYLLDQLFGSREIALCPCRQLAQRTMPDHSRMERGARVLYPISFTWALEGRVSQEQCLALLLQHFDFTRGVNGIENASLEYFGDSLEHLNDDQHIELIMMIKNPSLYDKARRPELFKAEFERLKALVSKS